MDQLGDLLDNGVGIGILSLLVSIALFIRQNRTNAKMVSVQERLAEIEEARHRQETARAGEADVQVSLKSNPRTTGRGRNYHLSFENKGAAVARDVEMTEIVSPSGSRREVPHACEFFPLAELRPGNPKNCSVNLTGEHGRYFEVTVVWTDERGRQTETQTVTPDT